MSTSSEWIAKENKYYAQTVRRQPVVIVLLTEMGPMVAAERAPLGPADLPRWASAD